MENYGKTDPVTGIHTRLLDFSRALNFCIDTAIKEKVDFFLFSGDAYKTPHPTQTQQRLLIQAFMRLYDAQIPVVIIVGNHDHPLSFGKAHALDIFKEFALQGFHVIAKPKVITLETKNGPINILGIPWPMRNNIALKNSQTTSNKITEYISQAVTHIIKTEAEKLDPQIPAVLAGHMTVSNGIFSGSEKRAVYGTDPLFLPSQLAIEPFDYVGLGHLHRYQNLNPKGHIPIIYSGSIERVDFGERKEDKGFVLVTIKNKHEVSWDFIKTPVRPFIQIEVKLQKDENQTKQVIAAISQYDIVGAVVKILYHLPDELMDTVDLKKIQQACQDAHFLVGVIPIRPIAKRTRRINDVKVSMDIRTLLSTYLTAKPELAGKQELLVEKAMALLEQETES